MKRVLLVSPSYSELGREVGRSTVGVKYPPPLGLLYIAGTLSHRGVPVTFVDLAHVPGGWRGMRKRFRESGVDLLGLTATTPQFPAALAVARDAKRLNPSCLTVLGGPHVSALPEESLAQSGVDAVVVGEGEDAMLELAQGSPLADVQGLLYKDGEGNPVRNPPRPLIEDLDALPYPLYDDTYFRRYGHISWGARAMGVLSGRGCRFNCSFCASGAVHRHRYRLRSPENVVEEVRHWNRRFGVRRFGFTDNTFTTDPARVEAICSRLSRLPFRVAWGCMTREDCLDGGLLRAMRRAGCRTIEIGVESGDPEVRARNGKPGTLGHVERVVAWAGRLGIHVNAYFILGLPYDTPETVERTIRFARRLKVNYAQFSLFTPLPGSRAWTWVNRGEPLSLIHRDWSVFTRHETPVVRSPALSPEHLLALYRKAVRSFYFNPAYWMRLALQLESAERVRFLINGFTSFIGFYRRLGRRFEDAHA
ncbi:MAG: B12-binding domain-containing radical SAM protein [Planctomycetota bacterium]|jgi:radical SAM superfamily enzyme YgiQ (UPF0313 family)